MITSLNNLWRNFMKAFVISDIHSFYDEMIEALNKAGYDKNNSNHMLICLGDLLDRGPKPLECLKFINSIPDTNKILIRGNHEDLMEEAMFRYYFATHDYHNGTNKTAIILSGLDDSYSDDDILAAAKENEEWKKYINSVVDFYETDKYVFVHGWIPTGIKKSTDERWKSLPEMYRPTVPCYIEDWQNGDWYNARWTNGMKAWLEGIKVPNKTVFCGHYHASWGHCNINGDGIEFLEPFETFYIDPDTGKQEPHVRFDSFKNDGIVALDACTVLSKFVNCEVINRFPKKKL